jgi:hypothetical protein
MIGLHHCFVGVGGIIGFDNVFNPLRVYFAAINGFAFFGGGDNAGYGRQCPPGNLSRLAL